MHAVHKTGMSQSAVGKCCFLEMAIVRDMCVFVCAHTRLCLCFIPEAINNKSCEINTCISSGLCNHCIEKTIYMYGSFKFANSIITAIV